MKVVRAKYHFRYIKLVIFFKVLHEVVQILVIEIIILMKFSFTRECFYIELQLINTSIYSDKKISIFIVMY